MIEIVRTNAENQDFIKLVELLDAELAIRDGDAHEFYDQFNKLSKIKYVVIAMKGKSPLGCGAMREYQPSIMEVKRMYVLPQGRKKGIATRVLKELENWAAELAYETFILETGKNQPEAIQLYTKCGYKVIENYGPYANIENSICFEKQLA